MRGRKSKYKEYVETRLDEIEKWAAYKSDGQIAEALGIGKGTFCEYKNKYPDLLNALKRGRQKVVDDVRSALIERAKGFHYKERKLFYEGGDLVRVEVIERYAPADVAAANLVLKNYDPSHWANDPQTLELRKKELALKEKQIEEGIW